MLLFIVLMLALLPLHAVRHNGMVEPSRKLRKWCPPPNFVENRNKSVSKVKTALISEVHGQLVQTGDNWGIFHNGNLLSRNMHHHIGFLGYDKLYLHVLYNDSIHLTPPTLEEIYPSSRSCVKDWYDTGVLVWKPIIYASKNQSNWERHPKQGNVLSKHKNLYKTLRGINPTYASIKHLYDWIMVLDIDEYLLPVNFKPTASDWCRHTHPRILPAGLHDMQVTARSTELQSFKIINSTRYQPTKPKTPCDFGYSRDIDRTKCKAIMAFVFPVYYWVNQPITDSFSEFPSRRSIFPSKDAYIKTSNIEQDYQVQDWKSIHLTKLTPYLEGLMSMHYGVPQKWGKSFFSPRSYHAPDRLTFEIAHIKKFCNDECQNILMDDDIIQRLSDSYIKCMNEFHFAVVNHNEMCGHLQRDDNLTIYKMPCRCKVGDCSTCTCSNGICTPACHGGTPNPHCIRCVQNPPVVASDWSVVNVLVSIVKISTVIFWLKVIGTACVTLLSHLSLYCYRCYKVAIYYHIITFMRTTAPKSLSYDDGNRFIPYLTRSDQFFKYNLGRWPEVFYGPSNSGKSFAFQYELSKRNETTLYVPYNASTDDSLFVKFFNSFDKAANVTTHESLMWHKGVFEDALRMKMNSPLMPIVVFDDVEEWNFDSKETYEFLEWLEELHSKYFLGVHFISSEKSTRQQIISKVTQWSYVRAWRYEYLIKIPQILEADVKAYLRQHTDCSEAVIDKVVAAVGSDIGWIVQTMTHYYKELKLESSSFSKSSDDFFIEQLNEYSLEVQHTLQQVGQQLEREGHSNADKLCVDIFSLIWKNGGFVYESDVVSEQVDKIADLLIDKGFLVFDLYSMPNVIDFFSKKIYKYANDEYMRSIAVE